MVQDLSLTAETEQGVRGDPTSFLFPLQSTSDRQAVAGATRATSTHSSVLFGSPSVPHGLLTFLQALTPGADEFRSRRHPSSSCWRRREHRDQGRVRQFDKQGTPQDDPNLRLPQCNIKRHTGANEWRAGTAMHPGGCGSINVTLQHVHQEHRVAEPHLTKTTARIPQRRPVCWGWRL